MAIIQIVLDKKLLNAADNAAKQQHVNRSALIREALQRHLKHLHGRRPPRPTALAPAD